MVAVGPQADRIMLVTTTSDMSKNVDRFTISLLLRMYNVMSDFGWVNIDEYQAAGTSSHEVNNIIQLFG